MAHDTDFKVDDLVYKASDVHARKGFPKSYTVQEIRIGKSGTRYYLNDETNHTGAELMDQEEMKKIRTDHFPEKH